jgi:hypothetical protein
MAREFSDALGREVTNADIPPGDWEQGLKRAGLPEHVVTMGQLHRAGRYDRQADGVERVTGRSPMGVREFVSLHADAFDGRRPLRTTAPNPFNWYSQQGVSITGSAPTSEDRHEH